MWIEMIIAFIAALSLVGIYWAIRGYPPGVSMYQASVPPVSNNGLDPNQAKFMFFYTPWCPHCKTAKPIWASFKETLKNTPSTFGGHTIAFEEINCDSDKGKSALYKIEGYPTFKVENKTSVFEFKGKPTVKGLNDFLVKVLGAQKPA
jgi:thiol-disulfide isomerase/thioredoxin